MRKKKFGILSLSALLAFGAFTPGVVANTVNEPKPEERMQIQIASAESVVSKEVLVERVRELFPGTFDFVSINDFHLQPSHRFPEDLDHVVRHSLYFSKEVSGNYVHGNFEFIGEDLDLQHFYYRPHNVEDALFPPKVSRVEAEEIAEEFISNLADSGDYKLRSNGFNFYPGHQQTLTEPIRYHFAFQKHQNGVPISDQHVNVEVLGNGDVVNFSGPHIRHQTVSYEDVNDVMEKSAALEQVKENFAVDLQYFVNYDHRTEETDVRLAYLPLPNVQGVHAPTGNWFVQNEFVEEVPSQKELEMLVEEPLEAKQEAISLDEAKAIVEELLNVDDYEELTLQIDRVEEVKNFQGRDVISVMYMVYDNRGSGSGTNIEIDKQTGEILRFHDLRREFLIDMGKIDNVEEKISYEEALEAAIKYAKQYAPSKLHQFAYPLVESTPSRDTYHFSFPRVENGILVSGQSIGVGVSVDGMFTSISVNEYDVGDWPAKADVISEDEAVQQFSEKLDLELTYMSTDWQAEELQYQLVYTPDYDGNYLINAITGEWESQGPAQDSDAIEEPVVEDHWAEEELNFMIEAGIIDVDDADAFNPDASVTKGEALEVIMKSLTRFYDYYFGRDDEMSNTFDNIPANHELYQVVERAVNLGILDGTKSEFAYDEELTRQELAVWYVKALGLDEAAKHNYIFKLDFRDGSLVHEENTGYVALANAMGILTESNGWFRPDQEVTYGQVAVSAFRLARHAYKDDRFHRY